MLENDYTVLPLTFDKISLLKKFLSSLQFLIICKIKTKFNLKMNKSYLPKYKNISHQN